MRNQPEKTTLKANIRAVLANELQRQGNIIDIILMAVAL